MFNIHRLFSGSSNEKERASLSGPLNIPDEGALLLCCAVPEALRNALGERLGKPVAFVDWRSDDPAPLERALRNSRIVLVSGHGNCLPPFNARQLRAAAEIARREELPLVPVWCEVLDQGGVFSSSAPLNPAAATPDALFRAYYALSAQATEERPEVQQSLGFAAIRALQKYAFQTIVHDGMGKKDVNGFILLGLSILLAEKIHAQTSAGRVGILLPPGAGATIANLGVVLAGKVPVNLNFTAGRAATEHCIEKSGLDLLISAQAFEEKIKDRDFPYPPNKMDIADTLKALPKWRIVASAALAHLTPPARLCDKLGISRIGGDREAVLLFTSGSSGMPKGVGLTHRNVLGNIQQIRSAFEPYHTASVLACLPLFHSFGSTVTLWWAMLAGVRAVTWPSPLDAGRLVELIGEHKIEMICSTPTFLRSLLRKAKPEQFAQVKLLVAGAEKLPVDVREAFLTTLKVPICEGYGTTEASPVVSSNLPEQPGGPVRDRPGSVGRAFPGVQIRIRDMDTGEPLGLNQQGLIHVSGANIFDGYLGDPEKTAAAMSNGWYNTGDLGRIDEDGFLFVEGRLSRFSKIGGEMVPHGLVEDKINAAFGITQEEAISLVVTGVPDERKGEALVVLTTREMDAETLRQKLKDAQLPELWMPRKIYKVESIPVLGTGKLNLKECQKLAAELASKGA